MALSRALHEVMADMALKLSGKPTTEQERTKKAGAPSLGSGMAEKAKGDIQSYKERQASEIEKQTGQ